MVFHSGGGGSSCDHGVSEWSSGTSCGNCRKPLGGLALQEGQQYRQDIRHWSAIHGNGTVAPSTLGASAERKL